MAVARWISIDDPKKRSKKYLGWYWIERHERAAERPERFFSEEIASIQKRFEAEKSQFEGKLNFAKTWYQPEAMLVYDLFKQAGLEEVYENAYRPLSATEHSDGMTDQPMFANAKMEDGERKLEIQNASRAAGRADGMPGSRRCAASLTSNTRRVWAGWNGIRSPPRDERARKSVGRKSQKIEVRYSGISNTG